MAVVATNPSAVTIDGLVVGVIADARANYVSQQSAIDTSFNAGIPSSAVLKFPYLLAGYNAGVTVALATLNQACQAWFGRAGNDAASYPYVATGVSLRWVKRILCTGDSLVVGIGSTAPQAVPGGTDFPTYLCEHYAGWAAIPRINQGHGSTGIGSGSNNLTTRIPTDITPYKPTSAGEKVVLIMWTGATDIYTNGRTGAQLLTDTTAYITAIRALGTFYIVLCNQPNPYSSGGISNGYWSASNNTQFGAYNTGISGCGADLVVDLATSMSFVSAYANSGNLPHFSDAGYAKAADLINTALSNP